MALDFELVLPGRRFFRCDGVECVTIPAVEGEMTVYKNHIPTIAKLHVGTVTVNKTHENFEFFVSKGFVQIARDGVYILSEQAAKIGEHGDLMQSILVEAKALLDDTQTLGHEQRDSLVTYVASVEKLLND